MLDSPGDSPRQKEGSEVGLFTYQKDQLQVQSNEVKSKPELQPAKVKPDRQEKQSRTEAGQSTP